MGNLLGAPLGVTSVIPWDMSLGLPLGYPLGVPWGILWGILGGGHKCLEDNRRAPLPPRPPRCTESTSREACAICMAFQARSI